jgi:hypothetical protein
MFLKVVAVTHALKCCSCELNGGKKPPNRVNATSCLTTPYRLKFQVSQPLRATLKWIWLNGQAAFSRDS